jgi:hypothetical protein
MVEENYQKDLMTARKVMQGEKITKTKGLCKSCGKVRKSVEIGAKLEPLAIKEAGGLLFFYPGKPLARRSGIKQPCKNQDEVDYATGLGWAAKCAANANGPEWNQRFMPMSGPVLLGAVIFRQAPATNKPDLDNYIKLIADALTIARIYVDDAQIVGYWPGTRKEDSATEGIRVLLIPTRTPFAQRAVSL